MFAVNTQKRTSIKSSQGTGREGQRTAVAAPLTCCDRNCNFYGQHVSYEYFKILHHAAILIFPEHQMGLQLMVFATGKPVFASSLYPWQSVPRERKKVFADQQFVARLVRTDVN